MTGLHVGLLGETWIDAGLCGGVGDRYQTVIGHISYREEIKLVEFRTERISLGLMELI